MRLFGAISTRLTKPKRLVALPQLDRVVDLRRVKSTDQRLGFEALMAFDGD
jgi:hypothetical protein